MPNDILPPMAELPADASTELRQAAIKQYSPIYGQEAAEKHFAAHEPHSSPPTPPEIVSDPLAAMIAGASVATGTGLGKADAIKGARSLIAAGVDPAKVLEAAAVHGVNAEDIPRPIAVDPNERQAQALDQHYAVPEKYDLQYDRTFLDGLTPDEVAAVHSEITDAFKQAGVPGVLAQPILSEIISNAGRFDDMLEPERNLIIAEEKIRLGKLVADPAETQRLVGIAYRSFPKEFQQQLDENFALHSAQALLLMAEIGRGIEHRNKRKSK